MENPERLEKVLHLQIGGRILTRDVMNNKEVLVRFEKVIFEPSWSRENSFKIANVLPRERMV